MTDTDSTTATTAASVAAHGAPSAPKRAGSKEGASPKKCAPTGQRGAKGKAVARTPATKATARRQAKCRKTETAREGSKKAAVLALLERPRGATLTEIMKATKWQAHTVRGFISGTLGSKMSLKVKSLKREDGERLYSIAR